MATEFVRARNEALDAESVLPASALPYLAGWKRIDETPQAAAPATAPPAPDAPAPADAPASADIPASAEPALPGSTPVGHPTRKPTPIKES